MVGAVSDIQLWCLRLPIELGRPLRLCMVMHVLRNFFILWATLIFCGVNDLYKIKRTLERRNHTTKLKVDELATTILGCCACSYYATITAMHIITAVHAARSVLRVRWVGEVAGQVPRWLEGLLGQKNWVHWLPSLACWSDANYQDMVSLLTTFIQLTLLHRSAYFFGAVYVAILRTGAASFACIFKK